MRAPVTPLHRANPCLLPLVKQAFFPVTFSWLLGHGGVKGFCPFKPPLFFLDSQVLWFRAVELFVEKATSFFRPTPIL